MFGHIIGSRFSNSCIYVILFHLQFLLAFVLRHVADDDLLARFQAADDLDVVVVALAEADLAGMEEVAVEDEEGVVAGATVEGAVVDAEHVFLDAGDDEDFRSEAGAEARVRHVVGHDCEGDGTALAQGRNGVDDTRQAFLADAQYDLTADADALAVAVGDFALSLEVREVADHGNLLTCADGAADLAVDVGECGTARRADLGIVERAALLVESLLEDAVLELLHTEVGLPHALLVLVLLTQLRELHLGGF